MSTHTGSGSSPPPLYNMGGGCTPRKTDFTNLWDSEPESGFGLLPGRSTRPLPYYRLSCDKLLLILSPPPDSIPNDHPSLPFGPFQRSRNHGSDTTQRRVCWLFDGGLRIVHTHPLGSMIPRDRVHMEFSPNRLGRRGLWAVASLCSLLRCSPLDAVVKRLDFCWTGLADPYAVEFDSPYSKPDSLGLTERGPETSRIGYRKGAKVKGQRYDKAAQLRHLGWDLPSDLDLCRIEFQCWDVPSPDAPDRLLFLRDLDRISWPAPDHYRVLRRSRPPTDYSESLWQLLAWASINAGPKVTRRLARENLPGPVSNRAAQAEFVLYDDLTPHLRRSFSLTWPDVVSDLWSYLAPPSLFNSGGSHD